MDVPAPKGPPGARYRVFLAAYGVLLAALSPLIRRYFRKRSKGDTDYGRNLEERRGEGEAFKADLWVHAVSLGEMTSAEPLIARALADGHRVLTTHATPAGRRRAETRFAAALADGAMAVRYAPVDRARYWRRFHAHYAPKIAVVMEMEFWPNMIECARAAGVPLVLVNSQVPSKSFPRARRMARLVGHPVASAAAVFAKSDLFADRFRALGAKDVWSMGETRFDIPAPKDQLEAGRSLAAGRPVVTLASVVEGEEKTYIGTVREVLALEPPLLVVWVPRAPERFGDTAHLLRQAGFRIARRSEVFDADLRPKPGLGEVDILLGDSLGEMFFYLAPADVVVVGGGFLPSGAHNIIEPLSLAKPVITGPNVWTIEYPAVEAEAAGVLTVCADADDLAGHIRSAMAETAKGAADFHAAHTGATERIYRAIRPLLDSDR